MTVDREARARDDSRLGPQQRRQSLRRMSQESFDVVVVVGGGVTGCGIALDAATRGLSVALVEMRDNAAGRSSRSGKLVHGGLRYLEQFNFALVQEALRERALMLRRLCPHLVRPVKFIYPLEHRVRERCYLGAGVLLYDTMGGAGAGPRHRHLIRRGALHAAPALRADILTGAITFYAQVDDARHTMTLARTAAAYGAVVASAAKVIGFLREGEAFGSAMSSPRRSSRYAAFRSPTRPACGPTRSRTGRRAREIPGAGVEGRAHPRTPRPHPFRRGDSRPRRGQRAARPSLGPALAHRDHGHEVGSRPWASGGQQRRHRLPAAQRQPSSTRRWLARTSTASSPGCARCCPASQRPPAGSAANTPSPRPSPGSP
jgi:hypothetical protein